MVSFATLKDLVGNRVLQRAKGTKTAKSQKESTPLSTMGTEPKNRGISIKEGRKLIKSAVGRKYNLPRVPLK